MEKSNISGVSRRTSIVYSLAVLLLLVVMWAFAPPDVRMWHKVYATLAALLALAPFAWWFSSGSGTFPFLELLAVHYFAIFVPQVFIGKVIFRGLLPVPIEDGDLNQALLLVLLGLTCLLVGYYGNRFSRFKLLPMMRLNSARVVPTALIYMIAVVLGEIVGIMAHLPGSLRFIWNVLSHAGGQVAAYLLAVEYLNGRLSLPFRQIYGAALTALFVVHIASGWLHNVAWLFLILFIAYVQVRRRMPIVRLAAVLLVILFLQSVKTEMRQEGWQGESEQGISAIMSRAGDWTGFAVSYRGSLRKLVEPTVSRLDQVAFLAHVVDMTPRELPYMWGATYRDLVIQAVPRFLWQGKPSSMDVPNELAIRYGWLDRRLIGKVAISPGILEEAFINFGWPGVVGIMLLFGAFVRLLTDQFSVSPGGNAILVAVIFGGGLMITWPAVAYFGGMLQTVVVVYLLCLPMRVWMVTRYRYLPVAAARGDEGT